MSVFHGTLYKRKLTGGRKRASRTKRDFEHGSFPTETMLGETKRKIVRTKGGKTKVKILVDKFANVTDPKTKKTAKTEITRVIRNPANIDYNRRGVITKGAIIETPFGSARVTSRPGQTGTISAILIEEKKT